MESPTSKLESLYSIRYEQMKNNNKVNHGHNTTAPKIFLREKNEMSPPSPSHNLYLVQPFVKEICKKHDIQYDSISFLRALTECLSKMKELAHDIVTPHEICSSNMSNEC